MRGRLSGRCHARSPEEDGRPRPDRNPAEWRKKRQRGTKVILRIRGEFLEILPQEKVNLTAFVDRAEVDAEADLLNWQPSAGTYGRRRIPIRFVDASVFGLS